MSPCLPTIWKDSLTNGQMATGIPSKTPAPLLALSGLSRKTKGILSTSLTSTATVLLSILTSV